ncbi:hypothetical protein F0562_020355 [Nyssa sinensis]|uniref:Legume lectin domain-containing protein n=1 Tax=Nyssa sinensis TaxID=561372 RepID=A0A5J5BW90_9ASTE|nr:hypothetical protein F0562_020355 [Nyssa sinensis]
MGFGHSVTNNVGLAGLGHHQNKRNGRRSLGHRCRPGTLLNGLDKRRPFLVQRDGCLKGGIGPAHAHTYTTQPRSRCAAMKEGSLKEQVDSGNAIAATKIVAAAIEEDFRDSAPGKEIVPAAIEKGFRVSAPGKEIVVAAIEEGFVSSDISFVYNGFLQANLSLDGASYVSTDGILAITNDTTKILGHALYPSPLQFKESELNKKKNRSFVVTFSTNFVFSINPKYPDLGGHGLAFVLFSTKEPMGCLPNQYLGLPNDTSNTESSTRILAVEFDIVQNLELFDINDNHVGIDISSLIS